MSLSNPLAARNTAVVLHRWYYCTTSAFMNSSRNSNISNSGALILRRTFGTGPRGARGHGWYQNYRAGKGGRHLQGEYHDRESFEECAAWNDAVLKLGSTRVYMDIVMEPRKPTAPSLLEKKFMSVPPLEELTGERYRIEMDIASTVMPETTQNFLDLIHANEHGYKGTRLYRVEKQVGIFAGDNLTNTGRLGKAYHGNPMNINVAKDPLVMWHIPGTITMIVDKVEEIDSRFMFVTQLAQHIDGVSRGFGTMTSDSLDIVRNWEMTLLTKYGKPTTYDLIIADCGVIEKDEGGKETNTSSKDDGSNTTGNEKVDVPSSDDPTTTKVVATTAESA